LLFYRTGSAAENRRTTPRAPAAKAHKAGTHRIKVCVLYGEIRIEKVYHPDTLASAPQSYKNFGGMMDGFSHNKFKNEPKLTERIQINEIFSRTQQNICTRCRART
jgi:hypothetical protein